MHTGYGGNLDPAVCVPTAVNRVEPVADARTKHHGDPTYPLKNGIVVNWSEYEQLLALCFREYGSVAGADLFEQDVLAWLRCDQAACGHPCHRDRVFSMQQIECGQPTAPRVAHRTAPQPARESRASGRDHVRDLSSACTAHRHSGSPSTVRQARLEAASAECAASPYHRWPYGTFTAVMCRWVALPSAHAIDGLSRV